MDRATLRAEVRARLGETTADFWSDADINRALDDGVSRFCAAERWPWLYTEGSDTTLVATAETMPLGADVSINRMFGLVLATGLTNTAVVYKPERLDPEAGWRARIQNWGQVGTPRYYYVVKAARVDSNDPMVYTVRFVPALDLAYDAYWTYMRVPAAMAADTDEPDMPEEYHDAVASWATGKLWLKELAFSTKAAEQFLLYRDVLTEARRELKRPTTDEVVAWGREQPGEIQDVDRATWLRRMGPIGP